ALTPDLFASLPVSTVVYAAHQHQQNGLQVDTQRLAQRHRPIGILPGLGSCACTAAFRVAQRRRRPACVCRQASADGQLPLNLQLEEREAIKENKDRVLVEELGEGDFCIVPELLIASDKKRPGVQMDTYKMLRDSLAVLIFYFLPVLGPVFAFWQWKNILLMVHFILGDERQLLELMQVTLTPATNGIVISSLAIAFGTLTSVTISSLRQRQKEVRQSLNKEACELALLQAMLVANIGPVRNARRTQDTALHLQSLEFLELYVARLHSESTAEASSSFLQRQSVADSELMAILNTLRYCTTKPPSFTFYPVRDEATMRIVRLNDFRADRLASINTGFPPLHWVILALLAASISLCFLIEVDQSEGRFLSERPEDSLRLRVVWSLMIGSFCGLTALCADLNDPFRGSFNVNESARQLTTMMKVFDLERTQLVEAVSCKPFSPGAHDGKSSF
ncbi:unnamed protein product, partial [Polarella glacialis]